MTLSPYGKLLLGGALVGFGIEVLTHFSLAGAGFYIAAVFLSLLFLHK